MKKNAGRLSKKVFAAMMAGTLMTAMVGMNVSAQAVYPTNVTLTKEITKEPNVYAPNTNFQFTITPGEAVNADADTGQNAVYAGPAGGAYFATGEDTITFAPNSTDIGKTSVTNTTDISINDEIFAAEGPGIYRYNVTEVSGNYDGIVYSTETKYFDVYVDSKGEVYSYSFVSTENDQAKDDGIFTNDYKKDNIKGGTHDITLKKVLGGKQADYNQEYTFTIKIDGADGEQYYLVYSDEDKDPQQLTLTSGASQTITLGHDETATIYGLSKNDIYTITENDYSDDGYTTTFKVGDGKDEFVNTKTGNITSDTNITVTNTKNASTPTGIAMTYGPYALMVALAGGMAVLFFRRRNREDY